MGSFNNSRAYARFKRLFVGPLYPRSARRQREKNVEKKYGNKPLDLETKKPRLDRGDIRLICDRKALHKKITPCWADLDQIRQIYLFVAKMKSTLIAIVSKFKFYNSPDHKILLGSFAERFFKGWNFLIC